MRLRKSRPSQVEEPLAGQESVWDYPRPPRAESVEKRIRVEHRGQVVADSRKAIRILETASPPTFYIPAEDVRLDLLEVSGRTSHCEWKGRARYWSLLVGGETVADAAWGYPRPAPQFERIRDHLAFFAGKVDACFVGDERVRAQAGGFYGGWITSEIVGPFKGDPGTEFW